MINTAKRFSVGQKVRLNSGSPELTVVVTGEPTTVEWMDDSTKVTHSLPSACFTAL